MELLDAVIYVYEVPFACLTVILGAKKFQKLFAVFAQALLKSRGLRGVFVMRGILIGAFFVNNFFRAGFILTGENLMVFFGLIAMSYGLVGNTASWLGGEGSLCD